MNHSLLLRILTTVCPKLWAVLVFLGLFATIHLLDFAWPALASTSQHLVGFLEGLLR